MTHWLFIVPALLFSAASEAAEDPVEISGDLMQWHKVTLTIEGPQASESDDSPNPFLDYRLTVEFAHESGEPIYRVPGYFAADGNAAETSATTGNKWRAHLSPDKPGEWTFRISFVKGRHVAIEPQAASEPVENLDGRQGRFHIVPTDKQGRDFRGKGRLQYVGGHYLRFAGSGEYFLKAGPDAPETLLAYADFDGTEARRQIAPLKTWQPHVRDWRMGDPLWQGDKGKGLIGALNYLADKGINAFSFLTYNAGGDGDNVWPFAARDDKLHYDCSKLDQWQIVFDHATAQGLFLHFKLQETEMDGNLVGPERRQQVVKESLDGGNLDIERKLYCRELVARFGHALALNWNLGEENTQTTEQQRAMAEYLHEIDPYKHHIVIHTYPGEQELVYRPLLGAQSVLTGVSLQNHWNQVHRRTLQWIRESADAGRPWVVANDEQGPADLGVPPDPGYAGFEGVAANGKEVGYDLHDLRRYTLWGNLMAGGAGVEYYFGYQLPQNDLNCEDWRSRDQSWDYCRIALEFFREHGIPFWEMTNANALVGNPDDSNTCYCFAKMNELYLVYLPKGGTRTLDLSQAEGLFAVSWFDPRNGGPILRGEVTQVRGGGAVSLGRPPRETDQDWLVVLRR